MSHAREDSVIGSLAVVGAFCVAGFTIAAIRLGPGFAIPVGILACIAAAVVLRGPLGQALAHRIAGRVESGESEPVLRALEDVRAEVAELSERVDFAERMLAQQREPDRLQR
jgi:hypothetical protein